MEIQPPARIPVNPPSRGLSLDSVGPQLSSRQPVCQAVMPDAEISPGHNGIVSPHTQMTLEGGISRTLGQLWSRILG